MEIFFLFKSRRIRISQNINHDKLRIILALLCVQLRRVREKQRYNDHESLTSTFLAGGAPPLAAVVPLEAEAWPLPLPLVAEPSSSRARFWPALAVESSLVAVGVSVAAETWITGTPL